MKKFDFLVIGTGAANIVTDAALASGLKVALIEKSKFGGTCLTRGCIPTKMLLTPSDIKADIDLLIKRGLIDLEGKLSLNWQKIGERMWERINTSEDIREEYLEDPNTTVYEGIARFTGPKSVEVVYADGTISEELTADIILIATGARTKILDIKGLADDDYLCSENFFGAKFPTEPYKKLAIIGAGAIACEFASLFCSYGTEVHMLVRSGSLLKKEDEEISQSLLNKFIERGIQVHFYTEIVEANRDGKLLKLHLHNKQEGSKSLIEVDELFMASGIVPNTENLGLENTLVKTDGQNNILTNEFMETKAAGIYAIGDVVGHQQLRHKANYEAEVLAYNLFGRKEGEILKRVRYDRVPAAVFTYPQVASVGLTENSAKNQKITYNASKFYYGHSAKGYSMGLSEDDQDQFVKVIVDKNKGKILGTHAIGPEAAILIQPYVQLMNAGLSEALVYNEELASEEAKIARKQKNIELRPQYAEAIKDTMVIHPSLSEVAIWALDLEEE